MVVDEQGFLYVASEWERHNARATEVGQIMKLDPRAPEPPAGLVHRRPGRPTSAGVWATPALHRDLVIVPTNGGAVKGIDRRTGEVRWELDLPGPTWQSPVVVDDVLLQGDCNGVLHAYDVSDTTVQPPELWTIEIGGCIESTPAVWRGQIFFGTRAGQVHAVTGPPRRAPDGAGGPGVASRAVRALVMGVVNVTPDSFSDGGRYLDPDAAVAHGRRLVAEGADVVDVGGESTRPGRRARVASTRRSAGSSP